MITTRTSAARHLIGTALTALAVVASGNACAETAPAAIVTPLLAKELTGIPGKEAVLIRVEYPPGGASAPHRHDAHVFVYVLEGKLRMQVDGQAPVTLAPGETFYESPSDVHRMSANASATEPAKFVVFMVKDAGRAISSPSAAPAASSSIDALTPN